MMIAEAASRVRTVNRPTEPNLKRYPAVQRQGYNRETRDASRTGQQGRNYTVIAVDNCCNL